MSDLRERLLKKAAPNVEILRVRNAFSLSAPSSADDGIALEDMSVFDVFERRLDDLERQNQLGEEQRRALMETYAEAVAELSQTGRGED